LPVLVPELSYKDLEIQEGGTASLKWFNIARGDTTGKDQILKNLLKYCELDTLAMVRIWEELEEL